METKSYRWSMLAINVLYLVVLLVAVVLVTLGGVFHERLPIYGFILGACVPFLDGWLVRGTAEKYRVDVDHMFY